jgi:hypothetical protein
VFTPTIFDHLSGADPLTGRKLVWRYFEHGYCFLRFFEQHTFDDEHIVNINDSKVGFFELARTGQLPHVSFIDPHFMELPPGGNDDDAPADVAAGQRFVQQVAEAVISGPAWERTLLLVVYDEHGGFYDHVAPPPAQKVSPDIAIETLGIRVPALVISPWVAAGEVFGHGVDDTHPTDLHFDHTSIAKTIARRFLFPAPPYLGARYAAASDLSVIMSAQPRRPQFLPYLRHNALFLASQGLLTVAGGDPTPGTALMQAAADGSPAQDFSFEDAGDGWVRLRTHAGNLYVTVDESPDPGVPPVLPIRQHRLYPPTAADIGPRPQLQRFKLERVGISALTHDHYVVSSEAYPDLQLQVLDPANPASAVVLGPRAWPGQSGPATAWRVHSPLLD